MKKLLSTIVCLAVSAVLWAQVEGYEQSGKASFYADKFEGRTTASGERYYHSKATCAHLSLPFGTVVKITNLDNNKTTMARVNDRGPFVADRIIDLSKSVAERLDFITAGIANVKIEVVNSENARAFAAEETKSQQAKTQPVTTQTPKTTETKVSEPKTVTKPTEPAQTLTAADVTSVVSELYEVSVEAVESVGYSIQIASFKEVGTVMLRLAEAQKNISQKLRIQVAYVNGNRVYRIMAGAFDSAEEARDYKEKISKHYPDCFVVNLNNQN